MGRPRTEIDMDAALDLLMRGEKVPAVAEEIGCTAPTLRNRINEIQKQQGLLLQYREIQSLQLTALQAKILENITDEKIDQANLRDLVMSYKILKEKEQVLDGNPTEIKGLVAHLIHLEKQEAAELRGEVIDADFEENEIPKTLAEELSVLDDSDF